jgi:hypothetical protein
MIAGTGYSNSMVYGPANFNLNVDNYISMYIPNINALNANCSGMYSTFRVPLNTVANLVYYYAPGFSYEQWVEIRDSGFKLSQLQVILYDRFGKNLQPYGLDYSYTLKIEFRDNIKGYDSD